MRGRRGECTVDVGQREVRVGFDGGIEVRACPHHVDVEQRRAALVEVRARCAGGLTDCQRLRGGQGRRSQQSREDEESL